MRVLDALGIYRRPPDARSVAEVDADIREELAFHIDARERELVAAGASPGDAARLARTCLGDVDHVFADCREIELGERNMLQRINFALTLAALLMLGVFLWRAEDGRAQTLSGFGAIEAELASLRTTVMMPPIPNPRMPTVTRGTRAETGARALALGVTQPESLSYLTLVPPHANPKSVVYVLGKVAHPGRFQWSKDLTLTKLIALCGDFQEFANRSSVRIIRDSKGKRRVIIDVNFDDVLSGKLPPIKLQRGDQIYVPESFF